MKETVAKLQPEARSGLTAMQIALSKTTGDSVTHNHHFFYFDEQNIAGAKCVFADVSANIECRLFAAKLAGDRDEASVIVHISYHFYSCT